MQSLFFVSIWKASLQVLRQLHLCFPWHWESLPGPAQCPPWPSSVIYKTRYPCTLKICTQSSIFNNILYVVSCHIVTVSLSCHPIISYHHIISSSSLLSFFCYLCHLCFIVCSHLSSFLQALTTALHVIVMICVSLTLTTFLPSIDISFACELHTQGVIHVSVLFIARQFKFASNDYGDQLRAKTVASWTRH